MKEDGNIVNDDDTDDDDTDVEPFNDFPDDLSLDGGGLGDPYWDMGASPNIQRHGDLLKDLTNFDPVIQRRFRNWLGYEWDDKIQDYTKKYAAIINEKGARWAIGFLQTYQSKPNIITNINERESKYLHLDIIDGAWCDFPTIDDFDVKGIANWKRLSRELEHSALLVLAGAGDGKYAKFLGESVHRNENVSINPYMPSMNMPQTPGNLTKGWLNKIKNQFLGRK